MAGRKRRKKPGQKIPIGGKLQWKFREPPAGELEFKICERATWYTCSFGDKCTKAHSKEELDEWNERLRMEKSRALRESCAREETFRSFVVSILQQYGNQDILCRALPRVAVDFGGQDLILTTDRILGSHTWSLGISSDRPLKVIALLDDSMDDRFGITRIVCNDVAVPLADDWNHEKVIESEFYASVGEPARGWWSYKVMIQLDSDVFGSFDQRVVCCFGSFSPPYLAFTLGVQMVDVDTEATEQDSRNTIKHLGQWMNPRVHVKEFSPKPRHLVSTESERVLLGRYNVKDVSQSLIRLAGQKLSTAVQLTTANYRQTMHDHLYIEELAEARLLTKYNLRVTLHMMSAFELESDDGGMEFAPAGQFFASIPITTTSITYDTVEGRLLLQYVETAIISPAGRSSTRVYEVMVKEKFKDAIYLCLDAETVTELGLTGTSSLEADIQLVRSKMRHAEQHWAVDILPDVCLVLPDEEETASDVRPSVSIDFTAELPIAEAGTSLNDVQKKAVSQICAPAQGSHYPPPILMLGPFGTGKTFTLAYAAIYLLKHGPPSTKLLICTHSNSAADLYVRQYLGPIAESTPDHVRMLRVYYTHRSAQTVPEDVRKYCCVETGGLFRPPSRKEVAESNVIVSTLSTARALHETCIGVFTHIVIDEAAQATEYEALLPLTLAGPHTKVVLAGDSDQMEPELCSDYAVRRALPVTLLDRLFQRYSPDHSCRIMLEQSYRSHPLLTTFISQLFYNGLVVPAGTAAAHPEYHPLTLCCAQGKDVQEKGSTGYYNVAEVYEVTQQVVTLISSWPVHEWGPFNSESIGVVAPYSQQVTRIRFRLRAMGLGRVTVERVNNVQGKQFRVLILSTVRTLATCTNESSTTSPVDGNTDNSSGGTGLFQKESYGFLSNARMLTTALTRGQSLVICVGDPVSLASVGECRRVWMEIIKHCAVNDSLHHLTLDEIERNLRRIQNKTMIKLNADAPTFEPKDQLVSLSGQIDPNQTGSSDHCDLSSATPGQRDNSAIVGNMPMPVTNGGLDSGETSASEIVDMDSEFLRLSLSQDHRTDNERSRQSVFKTNQTASEQPPMPVLSSQIVQATAVQSSLTRPGPFPGVLPVPGGGPLNPHPPLSNSVHPPPVLPISGPPNVAFLPGFPSSDQIAMRLRFQEEQTRQKKELLDHLYQSRLQQLDMQQNQRMDQQYKHQVQQQVQQQAYYQRQQKEELHYRQFVAQQHILLQEAQQRQARHGGLMPQFLPQQLGPVQQQQQELFGPQQQQQPQFAPWQQQHQQGGPPDWRLQASHEQQSDEQQQLVRHTPSQAWSLGPDNVLPTGVNETVDSSRFSMASTVDQTIECCCPPDCQGRSFECSCFYNPRAAVSRTASTGGS